jgi:hypothetical protein
MSHKDNCEIFHFEILKICATIRFQSVAFQDVSQFSRIRRARPHGAYLQNEQDLKLAQGVATTSFKFILRF